MVTVLTSNIWIHTCLKITQEQVETLYYFYTSCNVITVTSKVKNFLNGERILPKAEASFLYSPFILPSICAACNILCGKISFRTI
jgi:hypothetical protein